jgi:chloramphenicol-sensitive protein RarD
VNRGILHGVAAYVMWGAFALYWGFLRHVPTAQVMGHRIVWSCVVLLAMVGRAGRLRELAAVPRRTMAVYSVAAILIVINWTLYVWAVTSGFVVESSLGYFITPLVSVMLGVVVLRESLRPAQWLAVALAAAGVLQVTRAYGQPPWVAFGLAASFGTYGLVKKRAPLPPQEGLLLETAVLALPAALYLLAVEGRGGGVFLHVSATTDLLLVATGVLTVLPLLLFASAVRQVPLSVIGILQYIAPTMQFLLGVFVFREPFSADQFGGFALVWIALLVFGTDGVLSRRRAMPALDEGAA